MSAFIVFFNRVNDRPSYDEYLQGAQAASGQHDVKLRVFAEDGTTLEGQPPFPRCVLLEFPDRAAAERWYRSPEYQAVVGKRLAATDGFGVLFEGVD